MNDQQHAYLLHIVVLYSRLESLPANGVAVVYAIIYSYIASHTSKNDATTSLILMFGNSLFFTLFGWRIIYYSAMPWDYSYYFFFLITSTCVTYTQLEVLHHNDSNDFDITISIPSCPFGSLYHTCRILVLLMFSLHG